MFGSLLDEDAQLAGPRLVVQGGCDTNDLAVEGNINRRRVEIEGDRRDDALHDQR